MRKGSKFYKDALAEMMEGISWKVGHLTKKCKATQSFLEYIEAQVEQVKKEVKTQKTFINAINALKVLVAEYAKQEIEKNACPRCKKNIEAAAKEAENSFKMARS